MTGFDRQKPLAKKKLRTQNRYQFVKRQCLLEPQLFLDHAVKPLCWFKFSN
jgi:hypothetical protein